MDWQQTTLNPAGREAFVQLIRTPADAARRRTRSTPRSPPPSRCWPCSTRTSPRRAFMAGDTLTMADIPDRLRDAPLARPAAARTGRARTCDAGTHGILRTARRARRARPSLS